MNTLSLPYPLSTNRYWKSTYIPRKGVRVYVSPEAERYKREVRSLAWGIKRVEGPCWVSITLLPKLTKDGKASKVRVDLDNVLKVTLDALNGIAWADDKLLQKIDLSIGPPKDGGGLLVYFGVIDGTE